MNATSDTSFLGQMTTPRAHSPAPAKTSKKLASVLLAASVAALVVIANQLIDNWAQTHVLASWLALWAVAVLAIAALRGVSRLFAQRLMKGLDAWSANLAHRRSDQRLWAMAQTDSRLMSDLQVAMDRSEVSLVPAPALVPVLQSRQISRMARNRFYYI